MLRARHFWLARHRMLDFLDGFEETPEGTRSLYLAAGQAERKIDDLFKKAFGLEPVPREMAAAAAASETGAVIFWGASGKYLVLPPFPIAENYFAAGCDISPLHDLLSRDTTVAVVLIRLGSFALGIVRKEKLIVSKVGTGLVHARHKKGGSSAGRFARHREKQIETFLTRVCIHARANFEQYLGEIDYVTYGGARITILELMKQCSFLGRLNKPGLPWLLDIQEPRQRVLSAAAVQVFSSQIMEWTDEER